LDGIVCQLVDTAGVEHIEKHDIDQAAQAATVKQQRNAHVQVLCIDSTRPLDAWERSELSNTSDRRIVVLTKCDAPRRTDYTAPVASLMETSSATGHGLAALRKTLRSMLINTSRGEGDVVASTASRCFDSLRLAEECLQRALALATSGGEELVAFELRAALDELGKVVGAIYTDDVLDRIFSRFCIGK
jgi:tRNA modification GTPase